MRVQTQSQSQGDNTLYYPINKIKKDESKQGYKSFFSQVREYVHNKKTKKKDLSKELLKQRIRHEWEKISPEVPSYPDSNASTWGDDDQDEYSELKSKLNDPTLTPEARKSIQYDYELEKPGMCMNKSATMLGKETGSIYYIPVQCRKPWCPDCGGWGGHIHMNRVEGVTKRVNLSIYQLQQLILTIPESDRKIFMSKEMLNKLFQESKNLTAYFFGQAVYDAKGHIKKYKLNVPAAAYLHLFGDPIKDQKGKYIRDPEGKVQHDGKFHPHINIQIYREGHGVLRLTKERLDAIKEYWEKCLVRLGCKSPTVNLRYSFITKNAKKYTAIKYMAKSFGRLEFDATCQEVKDLLVLGLKSFKFIRFWGDMANSVYADRMNMREEKEKAEDQVNEEMEMLGVGEVDLTNPNIERIARNLYRLKGSELLNIGGKKDEWKKEQENKAARMRKAVHEVKYH